MTALGTLVSHRFNADVVPFEKIKLRGRYAYNITQVEEIKDSPQFVQNAMVEYIYGFLNSMDLPIDHRISGSDEYHQFTIYRYSQNKYVFSFKTLKLPPCIIDNSTLSQPSAPE